MTLAEALPDLVADLEGALVRIGRGDVADQLREATIERWTYDDFADAVLVYLRSAKVADQDMAGVKQGETIAAFDDVMVDLDEDRRVASIEILGARSIAQQLNHLGA